MRIRKPRPTLRLRLTLVYGVMFFIAGLLLLGVTYMLFQEQVANNKYLITMGQKPTPESDGEESTAALDTEVKQEDIPDWALQGGRELRQAAATSLLTYGSVSLLVVGGAAAGFGWLVSGRMLAPLRQVTETAHRIAGAPGADGGLHERIALTGPDDEVKELADSFDSMVERLDRSFAGQRRFVANASHELRTPLTLNRALVELAMHRESASADVKRLGTDLLAINARHEKLIAGLLLLARSEHELAERASVDLADIVSQVVAQQSGHAETAGVTITEKAEAAPTTGDAMLLERLVHNLVENAVRYNLDDGTGRVLVESRTVADRVEVVVVNAGPDIASYDVPALFEPFRRLGGDRVVTAKGAGLGLSIARSVARAHRGEVTASPNPDGGLTVTVNLPRES
ncbi:sensor histidine kinase [Stackebrandtia nassauensis]|uniref:histidine kinase n=1 Tax=Stackebrandtia nassauensis (strain DSM 44728 / CIP 108903 / NRRL B-16338 / NBRC 102104 / LLR-40K-21) TaxID=446470 RepID=D3Q036_STANL|nr:HAMP domain-containing sensor histidine kinase [Stackebrandtia nassauensis]ADD45565.1 histidine kinase [Stackebrandtia nassauensis DSM 44728]